MPTTYKELVKAATLTGTAASLYTAPASTSAAIHAAAVNNPTAAAVTVNVYKVPTSLAADGTTKIASKAVPAGVPISLTDLINHKLEPGTRIFADGAGCTLNISGVEWIQE